MSTDTLTLPRADDLHVHVRQDEMLHAVAPLVAAGGVGRCLVMPNTSPPITTAAQAIAYRAELEQVAPDVTFLPVLYLTPDLSPDEIGRAAEAGVVGVKLYPQGVTTASSHGVTDIDALDPVLAAMEATGLVLEIHGEMPSDPASDTCVLNAEAHFLPNVERIHHSFPKLRIVMEHITSADAVDLASRLGDTVAATITAHHLDLTVDDWAGRNHNFCKPVAKYPHDRDALGEAVASGNPKFFLGSDSAPHPRDAKEAACACAGVFTSPLLLAYLADSFERLGCLAQLTDFTSRHGAAFYGLEPQQETVTLVREPVTVPATYGTVVPYRAGETLNWAIDT